MLHLTPLLDIKTGVVAKCCFFCGKDEKNPGSDACLLGPAVNPIEGGCAPRPVGKKCNDDAQCSNSSCVDNVCRAVMGRGTCKADSDCYPRDKKLACFHGKCGIRDGKQCNPDADICVDGDFCHIADPKIRTNVKCQPKNTIGGKCKTSADCLVPLDVEGPCQAELAKTKCENNKCVLDHRAVCYGNGQCGAGLTCEQSVTCAPVLEALKAQGRRWLDKDWKLKGCIYMPFERRNGLCLSKADKGVITPGARCTVAELDKDF